MKYKIVFYLLVSAFSTIPPYEYNCIKNEEVIEECVQETEDVWALNDVNIREGDGINFDIVDTVNKGTKLNRIEIKENGWSKILYNDEICYANSNYLSDKKVDPEVKLIDGYIKEDGNVDNYFRNLANSYFALIPKNVRNFLKNNNVNIYVTDKDIAKTWFEGQYSSVQGVTLWPGNSIYIEDREVACKNATIHECGHSIDFLYGNLCWQKEFTDIYLREAQIFKEPGSSKNYFEEGPKEYFAEVFNQIILNPDYLKELVPESYEYMKNLINSIN